MAGSSAILLIGAAVIIGVAIWKRCEIDLLKPLCDLGDKPSAKMQAISDQIKKQSDFSNPDTAKAVKQYINANPGTYKPGQILPPAKSAFANSLFSATTSGLRLSI